MSLSREETTERDALLAACHAGMLLVLSSSKGSLPSGTSAARNTHHEGCMQWDSNSVDCVGAVVADTGGDASSSPTMNLRHASLSPSTGSGSLAAEDPLTSCAGCSGAAGANGEVHAGTHSEFLRRAHQEAVEGLEDAEMDARELIIDEELDVLGSFVVEMCSVVVADQHRAMEDTPVPDDASCESDMDGGGMPPPAVGSTEEGQPLEDDSTTEFVAFVDDVCVEDQRIHLCRGADPRTARTGASHFTRTPPQTPIHIVKQPQCHVKW
eukprot:CAMPEP_0176419388 /NCGR_PEP_ID=MMETSP0127-20121128/8020_1 /TAXON_ID=938130 /ORGANISM="Platyophrya macrostoma, Strain WH" /LENGTH=267 /DNA_ID=CAMNT_0017799861 /DNA_START=48 /DNA_END=848 /DNA_ORIENTATION=+